MKSLPYQVTFLILLALDLLFLVYQTTTISISNHEADLLYGDFTFIQFITNVSLKLFAHNDTALRAPMILLHIMSVVLLYKISSEYLDSHRNKLWHIFIFILLPGVVSSALLVDSAGFIIFGLLLFIYIYKNFSIFYTYPLLVIFTILDSTYLYLFMSLVFYAYYKKDYSYLVINLILVFVSIYLFGLDIHGSPEGHLLDALGLYAAVFTPVIFIYIFYTLYKRFLHKDIDILWFISAVPLVLSLLLSFRQIIQIESFAPYFIMALPIAAQTFHSSYKVRLKMFRTKYKIIFTVSIAFLLINFFVVAFHRDLYMFIPNPEKHFARKMHIAKELSTILNERNINHINTETKMSNRLAFYGIKPSANLLLIKQPLDSQDTNNTVTISYKYRPIYKAIVTNINTP